MGPKFLIYCLRLHPPPPTSRPQDSRVISFKISASVCDDLLRLRETERAITICRPTLKGFIWPDNSNIKAQSVFSHQFEANVNAPFVLKNDQSLIQAVPLDHYNQHCVINHEFVFQLDIARAEADPWPMTQSHSKRLFECFLDQLEDHSPCRKFKKG